MSPAERLLLLLEEEMCLVRGQAAKVSPSQQVETLLSGRTQTRLSESQQLTVGTPLAVCRAAHTGLKTQTSNTIWTILTILQLGQFKSRFGVFELKVLWKCRTSSLDLYFFAVLSDRLTDELSCGLKSCFLLSGNIPWHSTTHIHRPPVWSLHLFWRQLQLRCWLVNLWCWLKEEEMRLPCVKWTSH